MDVLDRLSSNLAANLRRLREARGLTQQELSDASGVPRPTLAHLETGQANPTLGVLARVASALGVAMEQLVAVPLQCLATYSASDLPHRTQNGASIRELCPDSPGAFFAERLELPPKSELARAAGRQADKTYLACERGEVEVVSGLEQQQLRTGDVAIVARGAPHVCLNRGRGAAVIYCIKVGAWVA
ncbi:MAG TPA: XRE family transcriptional regulator [Polyangiaceae bacterium]|nr:XRE family transcriptional regulator [Polyangiaceae bacterium]